MVDTWVVFGGWALPPEILAPVFGSNVLLIDSNSLFSSLTDNNSIISDWQLLLAEQIIPKLPQKSFGIAGWSTGAQLAYSIAQRLKPACAVFISATPSFCRRPGFPFGYKSSILAAMREQLVSDPATVLQKFYAQCGIDHNIISQIFTGDERSKELHSPANSKQLAAGLVFLEQAPLLPVAPLPFPSLFLHGNSDSIIPAAAGKYFCKEAGGDFVGYEGPHAFFADRNDEISELIKSHFR